MKYSEKNDREVTSEELLTETVAELVVAIQSQNALLLVLAHKLNLDDLPDWKTAEEVEADVSPKIEACINLIRKAYGPSEADKS